MSEKNPKKEAPEIGGKEVVDALVAEMASGSKEEVKTNFTEEGVAEQLGIDVEAVRKLRASVLIAGTDFVREDGVVRITPSGIQKLLGIRDEKNNGGKITLIVEKSSVLNPNIVLAKIPGVTGLVRLEVRSNEKFKRHMAVPNCVKKREGVYTYQGPEPRYAGRI